MKIAKIILPLTILGLGLISCEKNKDLPELTPKTIELTAKSGEIITAGNDFGVELFVKTALAEDENFMLSPLSASVALTMVLNGADGTTHNQIKEMLGYPEGVTIEEINTAYKNLVGQLLNADKKVEIAIANALFYRLGFDIKPPYLSTLSNDFDTRVEGLDFSLPSSITKINKWAADNTNQKIKKVIDEISDDAVMFLMNALYFKGDWTSQFDKSSTTELPFHLDNGPTINVKTMVGKVGAISHVGNGYAAIELPYGRKNFSMVIIVPQGTLQNFYKDFNGAMWRELTASLSAQTDWRETNVLMPRFKFDYEKILNKQLEELGMLDAFIPYAANFSHITSQDIYVSFVKQNTFVDVNEEGTEAAAVTTIGFEITSVGPSTPTFSIDKPFVFAIRERTTNTLMFIGSVIDPS